MATFEHDFEISFRDVDKYNEISVSKIIECLEDVGGLHSDKAGYGFNNIDETKLTWVLLYWKIRIFKRISAGQIIRVKTWARNSTKIHTFRDFEMFDCNNNLIGIASSKWVLLDANTMCLTKITPEIIGKYEPENICVFKDEPEIGKLLEPSCFSSSFTYRVLRKDIDINDHMHNTTYLDLAYETLPEEIYKSKKFNDIEIMYKKEIKYGEIVKCLCSCIDDEYFVSIRSEDDKVLHSIIKLSSGNH